MERLTLAGTLLVIASDLLPSRPQQGAELAVRSRLPVTAHHPHRWRRLSWRERLAWSVWFAFQSKEDYGDPAIGARRREVLTVLYDMLSVLAAMIVWFVISAAMVELGPKY